MISQYITFEIITVFFVLTMFEVFLFTRDDDFEQNFYKNCIYPFFLGAIRNNPHRAEHLDYGLAYFYYHFLPIMKSLPNPWSGFYFLHYCYGSGYFKYRLTLIGVVDNFKIVPLHSVGYLTWRKYWRNKLYPFLVKKFPNWGHFTSVEIWFNHWLAEHKTLQSLTIKFHNLYKQSTKWRYTNRVNAYVSLRSKLVTNFKKSTLYSILKVNTKKYKKYNIYSRISRKHRRNVLASRRRYRPALKNMHNLIKVVKLSNFVVSTVDDNQKKQSTLNDQEWLSLENVFPDKSSEPFQELIMEYFEDQQDDFYMDDDEPDNWQDTFFGTNTGPAWDEEVAQHMGDIFFRNRYRKLDPTKKSNKDYHRVSDEVVNFNFENSRAYSIERVLSGGDGPNVIDNEDEEELDDDVYRWYSVGDWYFYFMRNKRLTDDYPLNSDASESFFTTRKSWVPGALSNPKRFLAKVKLFKRWLKRDQMSSLNRYWYWFEPFKFEFRDPTKPRKFFHSKRNSVKVYINRSRFRRRYKSLRHYNMSPFVDGSLGILLPRYSMRLKKKYYFFRSILEARRKNLLSLSRKANQDTLTTKFLVNHADYLQREGLLSNSINGFTRLPFLKKFYFKVPTQYKPFTNRRENRRQYYPKYQPLYSANKKLRTELTGVSLPNYSNNLSMPPTGIFTIFLVVLISSLYHYFTLTWYSRGYFATYANMQDPELFMKPLQFWLNDYSSHVWPGLPSWFEVHREAAPRGYRSWPFNPGIDSNLYVWNYWSDIFTPASESYFGGFFVLEEALFYMNYKWLVDRNIQIPEIMPPYISSWAHLSRGFFDKDDQPDFLSPLEKISAYYRSVDKKYFGVTLFGDYVGDPNQHGGVDYATWVEAMLDNLEDHHVLNDYISTYNKILNLNVHTQLNNPVWVEPRQIGFNSKFDITQRWLPLWEKIGVHHLWMSDYYAQKHKFVNFGSADDFYVWPKNIASINHDWTKLNIPGNWEIQLNQKLVQTWDQQTKSTIDQRKAHLARNFWPAQFQTWFDLIGSFLKSDFILNVLRVWFYFFGVYAFVFRFKRLNLVTLKNAIIATKTIPVKRSSLKVKTKHKSFLSRRAAVVTKFDSNNNSDEDRINHLTAANYSNLYYNLKTKEYGVLDRVEEEIELKKDWSWTWKKWEDYFNVARDEFSTLMPNRRRRFHQVYRGLINHHRHQSLATAKKVNHKNSSLVTTPLQQEITTVDNAAVSGYAFSSSSNWKYWTYKIVKTEQKIKYFRFGLNHDHPLSSSWLIRPRRISTIDKVGSSVISLDHTQRRRTNDREPRWLMQYVDSNGQHTHQYKRLRKRKHGWIKKNSAYSEEIHRESQINNVDQFNHSEYWLASPFWIAKVVQHDHHIKRYRATLKTVHQQYQPRLVRSVIAENFLHELSAVNFPGRTSSYSKDAATKISISNGYDVQLYEDDHNQEYYGMQSDEDYEEFEDFQDPWSPSFLGMKYISTDTQNMIIVKFINNDGDFYKNHKRNLLSYKRFCSISLSSYSLNAAPATYFVYDKSWPSSVMHWSLAAVDHPLTMSILTSYANPRLFRRITRWHHHYLNDLYHSKLNKGEDFRESHRLMFTAVPLSEDGAKFHRFVRWYRRRIRLYNKNIYTKKDSNDQSWSDLEISHYISQIYGIHSGGDLLWDNLPQIFQDELYQTGSALFELNHTQHNQIDHDEISDDLDSLELGSPMSSFFNIGYKPYQHDHYLMSYFRPINYKQSILKPTRSNMAGFNMDRYVLAEDLDNCQSISVDTEQILLDMSSPNYVEGYDLEIRYFENYAFMNRYPEDVFEAPNFEESDEEIPETRASDLPSWIVAAAVAGVSPGCFDPAALSDRLNDDHLSSPDFAELTYRVDAEIINQYYREHLKLHYNLINYSNNLKFLPMFLMAEPENKIPLIEEGSGLAYLTIKNSAKNAILKAEIESLVGFSHDRLQRDVATREHLRLWALTEVYFSDVSHGHSIDT